MRYTPFLVLLFVVLGCGNSTKVATGSNTPPANSYPAKRFTINQTKTFSGLSVTVGEIAFETGKITVGVTLRNDTKDTLTAYPDQGQLVEGKHQVEANLIMTNGDLSGDIHSGVEKAGSIAFIDNEHLVEPSGDITLMLGKVFTPRLNSTEIKFPLTLVSSQ